MRSRHRSAVSVVLVRHEARDVAGVITRSRASYREMVQNLAWPVGYNAVALPLAAGALAGLGVLLPAWAGAALMSASTIIVAMNAQMLRRLELRPAAARDERLGNENGGVRSQSEVQTTATQTHHRHPPDRGPAHSRRAPHGRALPVGGCVFSIGPPGRVVAAGRFDADR